MATTIADVKLEMNTKAHFAAELARILELAVR
jgi:hypothetical protein